MCPGDGCVEVGSCFRMRSSTHRIGLAPGPCAGGARTRKAGGSWKGPREETPREAFAPVPGREEAQEGFEPAGAEGAVRWAAHASD